MSTDAHPGSYRVLSSDQVQSYDPLSSADLARKIDPCSSSHPARSLDLRPMPADAPSRIIFYTLQVLITSWTWILSYFFHPLAATWSWQDSTWSCDDELTYYAFGFRLFYFSVCDFYLFDFRWVEFLRVDFLRIWLYFFWLTFSWLLSFLTYDELTFSALTSFAFYSPPFDVYLVDFCLFYFKRVDFFAIFTCRNFDLMRSTYLYLTTFNLPYCALTFVHFDVLRFWPTPLIDFCKTPW